MTTAAGAAATNGALTMAGLAAEMATSAARTTI